MKEVNKSEEWDVSEQIDLYEDVINEMKMKYDKFLMNVPTLKEELGVEETKELVKSAKLDMLLYDPNFIFSFEN